MLDQMLIAVTTIPAVFLSQSSRVGLQRWACLFGLAGEPFWFYSSYQTQSWGVFAVAIAVTFGWLMGFRNFWLRGSR